MVRQLRGRARADGGLFLSREGVGRARAELPQHAHLVLGSIAALLALIPVGHAASPRSGLGAASAGVLPGGRGHLARSGRALAGPHGLQRQLADLAAGHPDLVLAAGAAGRLCARGLRRRGRAASAPSSLRGPPGRSCSGRAPADVPRRTAAGEAGWLGWPVALETGPLHALGAARRPGLRAPARGLPLRRLRPERPRLRLGRPALPQGAGGARQLHAGGVPVPGAPARPLPLDRAALSGGPLALVGVRLGPGSLPGLPAGALAPRGPLRGARGAAPAVPPPCGRGGPDWRASA
mmetsp:Transcript_43403/g.135733  ORF Transcript_43403/g.135733 Transcript_43403/m.135733 type:complete len:294 (-) Transcript_43403:127-1008(-)